MSENENKSNNFAKKLNNSILFKMSNIFSLISKSLSLSYNNKIIKMT